MRYRFKIEYDGSPFAGWQVQPGQITVQSELQRAFSTVLRTELRLFGSGRTDAGVHARGQVAQIDFESDLELEKIQKGVNALLPNEVAIRELEICDPKFSARFDATSRYYIYQINKRKSPLTRERAWNQMVYDLDIKTINEACTYFIGEHDFKDFCIPRNDDRSTLCTLTRIEAIDIGAQITFHIEGNRFLHRMVRALVGALCEIGRGRFDPNSVKFWLSGQTSPPRIWAPADGLTLERVNYKDY